MAVKKQTKKFRIQFIVFGMSLWLLSGIYTGYAQQIKWLRITELQSPINEIGAEYENEITQGNTNFFSWPAQYGIGQNTCRRECLWIGCKNFDDPVEMKIKSVKVIGSGPRDGADRMNQIFEQEIKLIGKYYHPIVIVNDQNATVNNIYDILDSLDENLETDRIVLVKFNTSIGVSVTKKVMAFDQPNHGNYFIFDHVFKNTGIIDRSGNVKQQTLNDVYFYFGNRYAFAGVSCTGFGSGWGAWNSTWGSSDITHSFGNNPAAPVFEMRGFYTWYGPNTDRPVAYAEDWGCPNEAGDGIMASAKYAGCVILHADKSSNDASDDLFQPRTNNFINPDLSIFSANSSQYDELFMADRYAAMTDGHPAVQHDELVDDDYPISYTEPTEAIGRRCPTRTGIWPYTLAPGDSIHIVFAEGVGGICMEKNREVGANWLQYYKNTGTPTLIMPDGIMTTDYNLYKRIWVETGKDSILQTYRSALRNYQSGFKLPHPPPPPQQFTVTSGGDRIQLAWSEQRRQLASL